MRCDAPPFPVDALGSLWRWVRSGRRPHAEPDVLNELQEMRRELAELRALVHAVQSENSVTCGVELPADLAVKAAADRVLDHVRKEGGALAKSERGLAALIGAPRSTTRRAVHALAMAGLVALEASRSGTVLKLVA